MGTLRIVVAVTALSVACKQGSSGSAANGSGSAASESASVSSASIAQAPAMTPPTPTTTTLAPTPSAAPAPEIFTDELYRAPGGGALFIFPPESVMGRAWIRTALKDGTAQVVRFTYEDPPRRAMVEVRFRDRAGTATEPRALAESAADELLTSLPGAKKLGGQALPTPGGPSWGVGAEADMQGAKIVIGVVAIAEGGDAVLVTTIANAELYEAPAVAPMLDAIYKGISVGSKVASAPSLSPATPLAGVFIRIGPALGEVRVIQLDQRGYALLDGQVGTLDVDTAHASGTIARYTLSGDDLRITPAQGHTWELRRNGNDFSEGGHNYCRAAATDGLTLNGRWESATFVNTTGLTGETFVASASSKYVFSSDGTYRDSSTVSATHGAPLTPGDLATPRVTGGASDQSVGRYRIAGDRLELTRGGTTLRLPFYARACAGKLSTKTLVIDGALYMLDDD
jgi:hypothetical protein